MAAPTLDELMDTLVACVVDALEAIERPVCDSGFTIGNPESGPHRCCQCTEGDGQVIGFLQRVYPVDGTSFEQITTDASCKPGSLAADVQIGVIRCYPRISEQGDMPKLDKTTTAADGLNVDIAAVWNAIKCCPGVAKLAIREAGVDVDPEAGCSAFGVSVTSFVSLPPNPVVPS